MEQTEFQTYWKALNTLLWSRQMRPASLNEAKCNFDAGRHITEAARSIESYRLSN